MSPERGGPLSTQTRYPNLTEAPHTPMIGAPAGPEHNDNGITPGDYVASPNRPRTFLDKLRENRRLRRIVGGSAVAAAIAGSLYVGSQLGNDEREPQQPAAATAPAIPGPEQPLPSPVETAPPATELAPLHEAYVIEEGDIYHQVSADEKNVDTIIEALALQRAVGINNGRADILSNLYTSSSMTSLDRRIASMVETEFHEGVDPIDSKYVFESTWNRVGVRELNRIPGISGDPTNPYVQGFEIEVAGSDLVHARQMGLSYPMPKEYFFKFIIIPDTLYDEQGQPTQEKVWRIAKVVPVEDSSLSEAWGDY